VLYKRNTEVIFLKITTKQENPVRRSLDRAISFRDEKDPYASLPLNRLAATYCTYASARRFFARLAYESF
jgi:hypothetical protein